MVQTGHSRRRAKTNSACSCGRAEAMVRHAPIPQIISLQQSIHLCETNPFRGDFAGAYSSCKAWNEHIKLMTIIHRQLAAFSSIRHKSCSGKRIDIDPNDPKFYQIPLVKKNCFIFVPYLFFPLPYSFQIHLCNK